MASTRQLIDAKMQSTCKPHYRHVALKAMPSHKFEPSVVSVKRCDGDCPDQRCIPMMVNMIKFPVIQVIHTNEGTKRTCVEVEVEEHTKCKYEKISIIPIPLSIILYHPHLLFENGYTSIILMAVSIAHFCFQ
jgi:predicted metal-binding protein